MKWNDIQQIAEALYDQYPDVDPTRLNFVDLHNKVVSLDGFDDDHKRGGEKFSRRSSRRGSMRRRTDCPCGLRP